MRSRRQDDVGGRRAGFAGAAILEEYVKRVGLSYTFGARLSVCQVFCQTQCENFRFRHARSVSSCWCSSWIAGAAMGGASPWPHGGWLQAPRSGAVAPPFRAVGG